MDKVDTQTVTWSEFIGGHTDRDDLDWDDVYGREALDRRRAERDGWGADLFWDGR